MCEVCVRARHCIVHYMDMDMDMVHGVCMARSPVPRSFAHQRAAPP